MSWYYLEIDPDHEPPTHLHCGCCSAENPGDKNVLLGWFTNPQLALAAAQEADPEVEPCPCCGRRQQIEINAHFPEFTNPRIFPSSSPFSS